MHKIIFLLTLFCFLASSVQAGGPKPNTLKNRLHYTVKRQAVTRTLKKRVENSYLAAAKATQQLDGRNHFSFFEETPVKSLVHPNQKIPFLTENVYPDAPFLTTNRQTGLYLQGKINREIVKTVASVKEWANQVLEHREDFERAQVEITHEPQEDATWLAKQISPSTLYLLVGEEHNTPEIPPTVNALIRQIRKQQPEREIFLFTEFVFHENDMVVNESYDDFFDNLKSDKNVNIPIIGIEPNFAIQNIYLRGEKDQANLWATDEGVRLRNAYWLNIIQQYRAQNPNALFIIYAGLYHTQYHCPYSLGSVLQGPDTFVVSFATEEIIFPFDHLTEMSFLFDRILQFNDKELARLSGTDVRIRIHTENDED